MLHYLLIEIQLYTDSFRIEYIPQDVLNKSRDKSILNNIFRIQSDDSICFQEKIC